MQDRVAVTPLIGCGRKPQGGGHTPPIKPTPPPGFCHPIAVLDPRSVFLPRRSSAPFNLQSAADTPKRYAVPARREPARHTTSVGNETADDARWAMKPVTSTDAATTSTSASSSVARSPLSSAGPPCVPHGASGRPSRSPPCSPPTPPSPIDTSPAAASTAATGEGKQTPPPGGAPAPADDKSPVTSAEPGPAAYHSRDPDTSSRSPSASSSPIPSVSPRVVYGVGAVARLPTELGRLHLSSPLIVSSPSRIALARRIQALVPNLDSRILDSAVVNVPARVVDDALDRITGRDVVISIGGASAVGLAKAIGGRKGIPHICIPTTYSGSEMMPLLLDASPARHSNCSGSRRHGHGSSRKRSAANTSTVRDPRISPTVIIYDEELTVSPSKRFSAPSDSAAMARSNEFRSCPSKGDETAQWSYIHLPGV